jgi:DNA repair exonuclease SbcCD nuclease subunit
MADCHVGSWRDPRLKELSIDAFSKAINICIENEVDFIIIAGDLFNNALPGIDNLKIVVKEFKRLQDKKIPVYVIPGSHDYSPSGKTMIDVLDEAGFLKNVFKGKAVDNKLFLEFTVDEKTGVKLTGVLGRRGTLEKNYYEALDIESLEKEPGKKIFLFHSGIAEMMPTEFALIESTPISMLPKGFEYYAGGHIHIVRHESFKDHKNVVYPGPLFPASFSELEKLSNGGLYIYDDGDDGDSVKIHREDLNLKNTFCIDIDANHKTPEEAYNNVLEKIEKKEFINTIVLMRAHGTLKTGKVSDVKFNELFEKIYSQGAFFVMKNTSRLSSEEFEEIKIDHENIDNVEDVLIKEHLQQLNLFDKEKEYRIIKDLMNSLSSEKHEGEKVHEYEDRIRKEADKVLDI